MTFFSNRVKLSYYFFVLFADENVEQFFSRVTSMAFNDIMKKSVQDETDSKAMKKVIAADSSLICESFVKLQFRVWVVP